MTAWHHHDLDCPRRHPQTDEFRCTCGADQKRAARVERTVSDVERDWIDAVNAALGEDRGRAPFVDDAVRRVVRERDRYRDALERIVAMDYRGNRPPEQAVAAEALDHPGRR